MEKKIYMPMEMNVEEFQMNEAVAGSCLFLKRSGAALDCEDCYWQAKGQHTFDVYISGDDIIGVSNQNAPETSYGGFAGSCGNAGIKAGMAILQTDGALENFFDPVKDGSTEMNGVVLYSIAAPAGEGSFWYDENGNIVYNATS